MLLACLVLLVKHDMLLVLLDLYWRLGFDLLLDLFWHLGLDLLLDLVLVHFIVHLLLALRIFARKVVF